MREPTKEVLLKDVANHVMSVKLDQGVYRHLEFRQADGSWNHGFHIVTTPHRLMITGDMGTWVFARIPDMFNFFRSPDGAINRQSWAEKLQNGTHGTSKEAKVYDGDAYKARLLDSLDNYDLTDDHKAIVVEALGELDFNDEHLIMSQINDFEVDLEGEEPYISTRELVKQPLADRRTREKFTFQDVWEIDMTAYSYHFVWCLYAIVWGINQYDSVLAGKQ